MNSVLQKIGRDAEMKSGRHGDRYGIDIVNQCTMISDPFRSGGLGHFAALSFIRVRDGNQLDTGNLRHDSRVMTAESPNSNHGHSQT